MNSILYAVIMVALWLINLLNDTGLGTVYQTTTKARMLIYVVFAVVCMLDFAKNRIKNSRYNFCLFALLFLSFTLPSFVSGGKNEGLHYLTAFILIYLLSRIEVTEKMIKLTGTIYLAMGLGVLFIFDYGTQLSGWNSNSIAMIGLYSYLFFMISYINHKSLSTRVIIIAVTVLYLILITPTNSRSCMWFAIVFLLFALGVLPHKFVTKSSNRYIIWLLVPVFVAIFVIQISKTSFYTVLDSWSINNFNKTIFNGRDILWQHCFKLIGQKLFFGSGTFVGNWHNGVLTALIGVGIVGTALWMYSLKHILSMGQKYITDSYIVGCILSFIIIYLQQSVELGLVKEAPNLIPYIILGVMLGRVRYLKKHSEVVSNNA